jgi:hypothetical protein
MSLREAKGREIADKFRIVRDGNLYIVPSQSNSKKYKVDPTAQTCSCPDHEYTGFKCKHLIAVELTIKREIKTTTKIAPNGQTTTITTETVKVTRKTYPQQWRAYNTAQTQEKKLFLYLLHQLCQGVGSPAQYGRGQRRLPMEDMLFAICYKVYSTVSGRRFMTDLRDSHAKGYIGSLPSYNSIFNYLEAEEVTPYLQMLIEESSLPLASIEEDFAVDSSGISSSRFFQWIEAKYTNPQLLTHRDWIKIHLICGVKTNVVTAVELTDRHANDSRYFKPLVDATAKNFRMREVSADKAYLSAANMEAAMAYDAVPYIPFKKDSNPTHNKSTLFKRMYHFYSLHQEDSCSLTTSDQMWRQLST